MVAVMVEEGPDITVVGQVAAARARDEKLSARGFLLLEDEDLPALARGVRSAEEAGRAPSNDDQIEYFTGHFI